MSHLKNWKITGICMLSIAATAFSSIASAQETLVDLIRAGRHDVALASITSSDVDVNAVEADGSTALLWATYLVNHELVSALLEAGAQADVTNNYGSSPLTEAVKLGDETLVRMLLDAGADPDSPNQDKQTALMLASNIGSLGIAELLIDRGADVNIIETFRGQTALMWAAAENNPDIAELLVKKGADVSVRAVHDDWQRQMTSEPRAQFRATGGLTALLYAARSGCYGCAVAIVEGGADVNRPNPDGVTPLINALDSKSFDIAMYLLDKGANASVWDMNGRTPLFVAVDMNSFTPRGFGFGGPAPEPRAPLDISAMDVVNRLLDMGVDTNHQLTRIRPNGPGRGRFADYMMRGGTSPLLIAALSNDIEAMQALIAYGAEVDLPNVYQITPLMAVAAMTGTGRRPGGFTQPGMQENVISTMDVLLDGGADINVRITDSHTYTAKLNTYISGTDHEGQTALMAAATSGWDKVVEHMLARGADPSIQDAAGKTALDAAMEPVIARPGAAGQQPIVDSGREATISLLQKGM